MQIRSRTWALIVWLQMLRAVRGQECTLQAFLEGPLFDPNFDTSTLQSSYAAGQQVQVSCIIGYSGFFKLICVEGQWQARGSKCDQTIKCHLPSTQLEGTSYDPAHITLFSTGTSVTVQCGDAHWIVNPQQRSAVSTCLDDGEWSIRPLCREVTCRNRPDDNVFSWSVQWWETKRLGDTATYRCRTGFRSSNSASEMTCTRDGWEPNPPCEDINEVKCLLPLTPLEGTSYDPAHITRFSPGTSVTVQCGEVHWIGSPNQRSAVLTCLENGQWSSDETVCRGTKPHLHLGSELSPGPGLSEVTCRNWRDRNVNYWSVRWGETKRLGDTAIYRCRPGLRSTNGASMMTCTRNGWEPNPPCEAPRDCLKAPPLPGGDTKRSTRPRYEHGAQVEYVCSSYHLMEGGPFKTCQNAEWIGDIHCLRPCTVDRDLMDQYHITFRHSRYDKIYSEHNDVIEFTCVRGKRPSSNTPMRQTCIDGQITLPSCQ